MENQRVQKRVRVKKFYTNRKSQIQGLSLFKRISLLLAVTFVAVTAAAFISYKYFYYQYEDIIQSRIQSGFWQSRAGIYSAPRTITTGQKLSKKELVDLLKRAGYVEGSVSDSFWNGSFKEEDNLISIKTNALYNSEANAAEIEIKNDKIIKIKNDAGLISNFNIKPEMLTGRSEAKRGENQVLKYEQIPDQLKKAIIYTEDRRFFDHFGVDPKAVLRAVWENVSENKIVQGGSTLTQQLVKNTFLSNEKTFGRKFSEAFLAIALENNMSKEDIFTLYCNEVYLGQHGITGIHGFGAASRAYFDKDIDDLNLAEAATLAALIKSPNRFSLGKYSKELQERRDLIIGIMKQEGVVSANEAEVAKKTELKFSKPKAREDAIAPYFVDSVIKELPNKILNNDDEDDDLRVYTTIDTDLQELAEKSVDKHLKKLEKIYSKKGLKPQATLVAMNPQNGHVLAMVGGSDYMETQFNRATQAKRQPGSTFKPFVYATAIERGILPTQVYADKPVTFDFVNRDSYKPSNYGGHYSMKEITMKTALAKSSNVIAVEVALDAGLDKVAEKSRDFGFENVQAYPSTALGTSEVTPLELATAYSIFANQGKKVEPVFIREIVSGDGGYIFKESSSNKQVISDKTAFMITDMLQAVVERGTASGANNALGKNVVFAGKTGSSNDGWFVGYTPNLVCVVWVGFDENEDLESTGGEVALPLWVDFMKKATNERPEFGGSAFPMPRDLVSVKIDPETGMLADKMCPIVEKVVVPRTSVSNISCLKHQQLPEVYVAENEIQIGEPQVTVENSSDITVESEELIDLEKRNLQKSVRLRESEKLLEKKTLQTVPKIENKERPEFRRKTSTGKSISQNTRDIKPYPTDVKAPK